MQRISYAGRAFTCTIFSLNRAVTHCTCSMFLPNISGIFVEEAYGRKESFGTFRSPKSSVGVLMNRFLERGPSGSFKFSHVEAQS